jgi:hypothetical protein
MAYFEQLHPWCIIRTTPHHPHLIVARFRKYNDTFAHLQVLRRLIKNARFSVIFERASATSLPES